MYTQADTENDRSVATAARDPSTYWLGPLNVSAEPFVPGTHVGPLTRVPVLTAPDESYAVVPVFSSNSQCVVEPSVLPPYVPGRALPDASCAVDVAADDAASSPRWYAHGALFATEAG